MKRPKMHDKSLSWRRCTAQLTTAMEHTSGISQPSCGRCSVRKMVKRPRSEPPGTAAMHNRRINTKNDGSRPTLRRNPNGTIDDENGDQKAPKDQDERPTLKSRDNSNQP